MKVLHVIPSIGPARGGPSVVIRTMTRSLVADGLEVHVATTDDNSASRTARPKTLPMIENGVKYWIFPRQTSFYLFSLPLTLWLRRHAAEYDVVHIHALFSYASTAAAICARIARVPYVVRPLGTLNQWGMTNRRRPLKKLSFRWIESRILKGAALVQYTSEQEALEARQLGVPHQQLVIPNPVDVTASSTGTRGEFRSMHPELADKTLVLFLSRFDKKKGLDLLLPAFAGVLKRHPEAILVLAGDGDPAFVAELRDQSRRLGIESAVVWTGFLSGEEKRALLADADLFVLPSYSENFGVAAVEALGAGLPAIVSDQVGIHAEISAAEAGLVVACAIAPLEAALLEILSDPRIRRRMGDNAIRLARRFSPDAVARELVETYVRIHRQHGQPVAA
jgi:glycosyltransferase involved in cell wall biosynthesis